MDLEKPNYEFSHEGDDSGQHTNHNNTYSIHLAPTRSRAASVPAAGQVDYRQARQNHARQQQHRSATRRILRSLRKHFWPSLPYSNAFVDASVLDDPASSESSSSPQHSHPPRSAPPHHMLLDKEDHQCAVEDSVDVVVLDRDFHEVLGDLALSTSMTEQTTTPATEPPDPVLSVAAPIAQQPSHAPSVLSTSSAASTAAGSVSGALPQPDSSPSARQCGLSVLRGIWSFLETRFPDPAKEAAYRRESWWMSKSEALTTVAFVFIAWIVLVATQSQPFTTFVKVLVCGVGAASVAPIIPLVAFDAPRKRPWTWQICLFAATWTLPYVTVLDIWHCNFYGSGTNHCTDRDFIGIFYFALGFPTFSLFMLHGSRLSSVIGALIWVILVAIFVVPDHIQFVRNLVNFVLFMIAIIWTSYLKERSDRRMFMLRDELKCHFRATQKAQIAERAASESKKRFVSYIFHEVRVPLNSALLAYQNLLGEKVFSSANEDQKDMVTGLSSSLFTMEKVLNDLLDFNRMEAGKLTWSNRPFDFHATFRALLLAFRGIATARNINLVTSFDPAIDAYSSQLLGDSMRFSQVVSNLLSNACKFTQDGTVKCVTKLLHPTVHSQQAFESKLAEQSPDVGTELRTDIAIIRIEIHDTGVGIQSKDLVNNNLFSPYHQTNVGLQQGGKGSGLGLALVRKIVKLSGGRLGVQSVPEKGSTFWIELAFGLPMKGWDSRPASASGPSGRDSLSVPPLNSSVPSTITAPAAEIPAESSCENTVSEVGESLPSSRPAPPSAVDHNTEPDVFSILVADDDPLTRRLMTRMLTRLGHQVVVAEDGLQAITLLRDAWKEKKECKFDAVLLDNQMPNMTGVECVREMRRIGLRTYVLGITGNALLSDQNEFLSNGADKVLTKPVLERSIREALVLAKERAQSISGYGAEMLSRQRRWPEHTASCSSGPSHHTTISTSSTLTNNTAAS